MSEDALPPKEPLVEMPAGTGLAVPRWTDAEGREFYRKEDAAAMLGIKVDSLGKRKDPPSFRVGKHAYYPAAQIERQRARVLRALGAQEGPTPGAPTRRDLESRIDELESTVVDLVTDLRAVSVAEDAWKVAALRRLPQTPERDTP